MQTAFLPALPFRLSRTHHRHISSTPTTHPHSPPLTPPRRLRRTVAVIQEDHHPTPTLPKPPSPPPDKPPRNESNHDKTFLSSLLPYILGTTTTGAISRISALILIAILSPLPTPAPFPETLDMPSQTLFSHVSDYVSGPHFAVSVGMGLSAFIQSLTGFGFAIVSVAALTQVPWIANSSVFNAVQPVAATLGALTGWILLFPEIHKVKWRDLSILLIASTLTTPVGAILFDIVDTELVIRILGALITAYVAYSSLGTPVPKSVASKGGAWVSGLLAGALGGAFDITGPPLVVHGEAKEWDSTNGEFRRNVLAVVSVNSSLVVLWDFFAGRLNDYYYIDFVTVALPTTIVGILVGKQVAKKMEPAMFKKVVLGTCLVMGVKLLFS